ncbi:hypothetical protein NPIL_564911 [Nephila pilipes]|uniref:Uncharacterized protein n=1 Tax=Nephila pilipes TaxID=299642 RepID=A0A8X6TTL7_NEPPI|nr:hypothetical protein NPIL_564911 [Nephila pilipes]
MDVNFPWRSVPVHRGRTHPGMTLEHAIIGQLLATNCTPSCLACYVAKSRFEAVLGSGELIKRGCKTSCQFVKSVWELRVSSLFRGSVGRFWEEFWRERE